MDGILEEVIDFIPDIRKIVGTNDSPYKTYQDYANLNIKIQTQLCVALGLGSFCILLFSFLRRRLPEIYEGREKFFRYLNRGLR